MSTFATLTSERGTVLVMDSDSSWSGDAELVPTLDEMTRAILSELSPADGDPRTNVAFAIGELVGMKVRLEKQLGPTPFGVTM